MTPTVKSLPAFGLDAAVLEPAGLPADDSEPAGLLAEDSEPAEDCEPAELDSTGLVSAALELAEVAAELVEPLAPPVEELEQDTTKGITTAAVTAVRAHLR
jgi:hypothetical protein